MTFLWNEIKSAERDKKRQQGPVRKKESNSTFVYYDTWLIALSQVT